MHRTGAGASGTSAARCWSRNGWSSEQPRRRQIWRCRAATTVKDFHDFHDFHDFLPTVPRLESLDERCLDCESDLDHAQGPNAPKRYEYAAREIAAALVALATGATYQQAALNARTTVASQYARVGRAPRCNASGMGHGQAAADWVEVFTDVVLAGEEDDSWPAVVLLDSTSFWRLHQRRRVPAFHVLMAYGYDVVTSAPQAAAAAWDDGFEDLWSTPERPPAVTRGRLLRAEVYPRSDTSIWTQFLGRAALHAAGRGR